MGGSRAESDGINPREPRVAETATLLEVELPREQRQLRACRIGFWFLGATLTIQLGMMFLTLLAAKPPEEGGGPIRYPGLDSVIVNCLLLLAGYVPGAALLAINARSKLWRRSAVGLAIASILDAAFIVAMVAYFPLGEILVEPEPIGGRIIRRAAGAMTWVENWFIVATVAEFALAGRAQFLVKRTALLGYFVFAGLTLSLAGAAWSLPVPAPIISKDLGTGLLAELEFILLFIVSFWMLSIITAASTLARILELRCQRIQESPPES